MHNTAAHHLLTDSQSAPEQRSAAPNQLPPVYTLGRIFCGMEYSFGQFGFPLQLLVHLLHWQSMRH